MPYCGLTKAAKKLPEKYRESFKDAFRATNCMDLYDGNVEQYFQVIRQVLEQRQEKIDDLKDKIIPLTKEKEKLRKIRDILY
jgi:hypothetical protein